MGGEVLDAEWYKSTARGLPLPSLLPIRGANIRCLSEALRWL